MNVRLEQALYILQICTCKQIDRNYRDMPYRIDERAEMSKQNVKV